MTRKVMPRLGQPAGWRERHKQDLDNITLPDGAAFYVTPGHGYLKVDFTKLPASVSQHDYLDDQNHALLGEDCSMIMWMAEQGLIPMTDSILNMIRTIPRTSAYGLLHPGQVVIEAGIVVGIDGKLYNNTERIIAGRPHERRIRDNGN